MHRPRHDWPQGYRRDFVALPGGDMMARELARASREGCDGARFELLWQCVAISGYLGIPLIISRLFGIVDAG
jgi:hypothetical protein